jgi:hypothetical protein
MRAHTLTTPCDPGPPRGPHKPKHGTQAWNARVYDPLDAYELRPAHDLLCRKCTPIARILLENVLAFVPIRASPPFDVFVQR